MLSAIPNLLIRSRTITTPVLLNKGALLLCLSTTGEFIKWAPFFSAFWYNSFISIQALRGFLSSIFFLSLNLGNINK